MAVDARPFDLSMISLLLLDLDGVVAIEIVPPQVARLEIILLHESLLHEMLSGISVPVVILTHRSRAEANLILQLAGLTSKEVAGVIAAEDILRAAVKSSRRWLLLRHGLKKSWILPDVEKRYGVRAGISPLSMTGLIIWRTC